MTQQEPEGPSSDAARKGKLGLALSGGGFRASFFHIGVLAQMATLGLLRHIEVISTVSGGSIVGALYYLHVKRLLEAKPDDEITDQDFVTLVDQLEREFLQAVQRNIRMRTFSNPLKNILMCLPHYSRSDRIGELYDEYFYRPVMGPQRTGPIEMSELKVRPKAEKDDFHPDNDNVNRTAKVPIILINATALNTGHNWRFEAARMGEPPRTGKIAGDIDKNLRLRRPPSYDAIIRKQQNIELGLAVAASAGVPGLFPPLAISGLYPNQIRVQLVDGGVHDNQGIEALLDRKCTCFVVSDASGQMHDETDPPTQVAGVLGRVNSIMMDRIREEELFRLMERPNGQGSGGPPVAFLHLRKGLAAQAVSWLGPGGQVAEPEKVERQPVLRSESFGVARPVQELLSRVRTDLDSFTDVEAYSLMLDGYRMSETEFPKTPGIKALIAKTSTEGPAPWRFLEVGPWLANPTGRFQRQLEVAGEKVLKVFRLSMPVSVITSLVVAAVLLVLWFLLQGKILEMLSSSVTVGTLLVSALVLALGLVPRLSRVIKALRFLRSPTEFLVRLVVSALLPALGSVFVWIHLWVFDPIFLCLGKVGKLGPRPS